MLNSFPHDPARVSILRRTASLSATSFLSERRACERKGAGPPAEVTFARSEDAREAARLAMWRAFELSQTEANSDSLTGLLTRQSLESGGIPTTLSGSMMCGHHAGDLALRTFSQRTEGLSFTRNLAVATRLL